MTDVKLDPARLVTAGAEFYSVAQTIEGAVSSASGTLSGLGGMAGDDNAAEDFCQGAEGYDAVAAPTLDAVTSIANGLRILDAALSNTGRAYDAAEKPGAGLSAASAQPAEATATLDQSKASLPSALGPGWPGPLGEFQELIEGALATIGVVIPTGDVGQLRNAATAWGTLGSTLTTASSTTSSAGSDVLSLTFPQKNSVLACRTGLATSISTLATSATGMQQWLTDFADNLEQMRYELGNFLKQMAIEVAAEIGLAIILGPLTAGIGTALMAGKVGLTIMRWARKIATLIDKLRDLLKGLRGIKGAAARTGLRAAKEGLQAGLASAFATTVMNHAEGDDSRYQQQNVGTAFVSAFAGGAVAAPVSKVTVGGNKTGSATGPSAARQITGETAAGAADGFTSGLVESQMTGQDFNPISSTLLGSIMGGGMAAGGRGINAVMPSRRPTPGSGTSRPEAPGVAGGGTQPTMPSRTPTPGSGPSSPDIPGAGGVGGAGGAGTAAGAGNGQGADVPGDNAPQPGAGDAGTGGAGDASGVDIPGDGAPQPGAGDAGAGGAGDGSGVDIPGDGAPQPGAGDAGAGGAGDGSSVDIPGDGAPQPGAGDAGAGGAGDGSSVDIPGDAGTSDAGTPAMGTPDAGTPDAGTPDAGTPDAGTPDAGTPDAGTPDAGTPDAGTPDAGTPDAGTPDAGTPDAGTPDAGTPDAGTPDAGTPDAGTPDAGTPDAGTPDAGTPDAGTPDAGTPDAGTPDVGTPDAGTPDAGTPDAGTPDAGTPDAGTPDVGTPDAGTPDAGTPDAGTPDAGTPDAGTPDAGTPDAGTPDAGTPDAGSPDASTPDASTAESSTPEAKTEGTPTAAAGASAGAKTEGGPAGTKASPDADAQATLADVEAEASEAKTNEAESDADPQKPEAEQSAKADNELTAEAEGSESSDNEGIEADEAAAAAVGTAAAAGLLIRPTLPVATPSTPGSAAQASTADGQSPQPQQPDAQQPDAQQPDGQQPDAQQPENQDGQDNSTKDDDSTSAPKSELTLAEIDDALAKINPKYDMNDPLSPYGVNCGNTSSNLFDALNGKPVAEAGTGTLSIPEMEARTGLPQTALTPTQIADSLRDMGAGSHVVVGIDRASGDGHWFNAFFDGTDVWALDAQTGTRSPWPPDMGAVHWDVSIAPGNVATSTATTPDATSPDGTTPAGTTAAGTSPAGPTPAATSPDGNTPAGATPAGASPDGATPDGASPDGATPDGATPDGTSSAGTTPEGSSPDGATPDGTSSAGTTPEGSSPDGATPDGATPDGATPDGATPDGTSSAGTTPESSSPDATSPQVDGRNLSMRTGGTTTIEVSAEDAGGARTPFAGRTDLTPNARYEVEGRGVFTTDASGSVVQVEAQYGTKGNLNPDLNSPQPNVTYVVTPNAQNTADGLDFRHTFVTDHAGRVSEVRVENLVAGDAPRSPSIQRTVGGTGPEFADAFLARHDIEVPEYDGGHLIGNEFGGGAERINMIAQLRTVNQNYGASFYRVERTLAAAAGGTPPQQVSFQINLDYARDTVPHGYLVEWTIDGTPDSQYFENI
ncbi:DNA/RNA non-specific endonuclease [Agrococcus sp. KRD186]|uniref:DNA/RNA non-specific endonuclease n=1 Tax=Agrococcus sp. KRD186 TaxID=2729730 RepID=UPI001F49FB38|nr:DNA/RNA non-specific endonuclease [Agrococcus sp. KRD186]